MKVWNVLRIAVLPLSFLLQLAPAHASTLPIVGGGLSATAILDSSFDFLGLDIRGTVELDTGLGDVILTDAGQSASFGNLDLTGEPPVVLDGTEVLVAFQTPSLLILPGPALSAMTLGTTIQGPLSSAEAVLLNSLDFTFDLTGTQPYPNGNIGASFTLESVSYKAVPEPATPMLCAAAMLLIFVARSHRKIRNS